MTDVSILTTMDAMQRVEVRPLDPRDVPDVVALGERRVARGDLWEAPELAAPGVVVRVGGRLAAAGWVECWDESDGTHLYLLLGFVDPAHRGQGIGRSLLSELEAWARQHAASRGVPATFGANADADRSRAQELVQSAGYAVAFTVVEMSRPVPAGSREPDPPPGLRFVPMVESLHPEVHALLEASFGTSRLGAVPRAYDEYLREVAAAPSGLDLWRVLEDDGRVVGVAVNVVEGSVGETPWVAVDPAYRGRGLGECLMRATLAAFAWAGAHTATLTTIAENPYRSVTLYERVGYRVTARLPRYRKRS
jgi:mycothiol synthase